MDEALCTLQYGVGRVERCPGARCPFWVGDRGELRCVLAPIAYEIRGRPELAQHLLELRRKLDDGRAAGRSLFYRLLDEEQEAES
jgi:hypothetical protein